MKPKKILKYWKKSYKKKKKYLIYEDIFKLIETCTIIESKSRSIIIEVDAENNDKLDDISKKYFMKKISQRRIEKKISHGYVLGNIFITLKMIFTNKIMRFSIERVWSIWRQKWFFIMFLIYRTFSNIVGGINVCEIDFKDVNIEMGKNFSVLFADFNLPNTTQEA